MEYEIISIDEPQPDGCRSAKLKRISENTLLNANMRTHQANPDLISVVVTTNGLAADVTGMLVSNPLGKSLVNLAEGDFLNFEM